MVAIEPSRMAGQIDGDFVVFLIGIRINKPWKIHKWWRAFLAMPRMLKELDAAGPETGFLGHNGLSLGVIVQYWRSFDHLEAYARDQGKKHWPAWVRFNKVMKNSRGDVGIWHETYLIKPGQVEAVYGNMPPFGLGNVFELQPSTGALNNAAARFGAGEREGA